jgi:hypothetical protein
MKKIHILTGCLIVITLMGSSTFGALSSPLLNGDGNSQIHTKIITASFSPPSLIDMGDYVTLETDNEMNNLLKENHPLLPYHSFCITFPLGTIIQDVKINMSDVQTLILEKKIQPAPYPRTLSKSNTMVENKQQEIYENVAIYPSDWVTYNIGVGIKNNTHVLFLSLQVFPYQYKPRDNALFFVETFTIKIIYDQSENPLNIKDETDFLIISPAEFVDSLEPLVTHKEESADVNTRLVSLDEVFEGSYFEVKGRDDAEKVKYFIKSAIEEWGVKYVLLVGGRHGGFSEPQWWCPVRYTYLDANDGDRRFLSDLYFSDIYGYREGEIVFVDWDSNENNLFGEWHFGGKDIIDMYPDIYIGRLPCRTEYEVKIMVDKIKKYETTAFGTDWVKKYVGIGGDTFPGDQWYDGEVTVAKVMDYLAPLGYDFTTLFTSDEPIPTARDILDAISEGCGFLNFEGHGTPTSWATHGPQGEEWDTFINVILFTLLQNKGMYPICVVGGCSNSKFDITLLDFFDFENLSANLAHGSIGLECFSWWLTRKINGGSIATIGCTSYGYGKQGDSDNDGIFDGIQYRGGFIDIEFFRIYAQEEIDILGEVHGEAILSFLSKFPPFTDKIDGKTVEEWTLFGDPTLKINGYPPS